jgi:hypothetical protein
MSHLAKLKIVAQQHKHVQNKAEHRRNKLLEKLDDQLAMIQAQIAGETFTRTRIVMKENEAGERVPVERLKRTRPWYWMNGSGNCYFSVWYGSKVIELKPGLTAINVAKREELPAVIRAVMDAVIAGELDAQIEDVAERGTAALKKAAAVKPAKKAS